MANIVGLTPSGIAAGVSFLPVAGVYGAGDVMGAVPVQEFVFTFPDGSSIPQGSLIRVLTTIMKIDQAAIISGETSYTLQGYSAKPPSAQADNDAWTLASADLSSYRGPLALGTPLDQGAACYVKSQVIDPVTGLAGIDIKLTGSSLFAELVTVGGFTATAVNRQVLLYGIVL